MEDVTNPPFRKFCKRYGADWLYSEFVSADALVRSISQTMKKLAIEDVERPVTIQIYGRFIDSMVEAAKLVEEVKPDFIDLNFGCPVKRVAQKGAGAGMLRDIPLMVDMARQVVKAVKIPVTAKTRLGWDSEHIIIDDIAEQLQDVGIQALAIHGRTRSQMYTGTADWESIGRVKNNPRIKIPIIGNGDIDSPQKAKEAFEKYGVDGVMIGRASIGSPWIFQQIKHYFETGELLATPSVAEQISIVKEQLTGTMEWLDESRGILHFRRHLAAMFKGLSHFRELRIEMLRSNTKEELWHILGKIGERYQY
ncbi:tRNA-dihydrouridine synthase [Bacteroidia bacterium]|nr:tRNA-dihydrouridine synthase [Bacteroidia bacterium]